MAASDIQISDLLGERVEEEIARAERGRTPLSCLLVSVKGLEEIAQTYGEHLSEQALAYVGLTLRRELRRYDRVGPTNEYDYLVVLPGADGTRGEIVARRALARLRAIKIEARDERRALSITVGIATWREGLTPEQLIAQARTTAGRNTQEQSSLSPSLPPGPLGFADALRI